MAFLKNDQLMMIRGEGAKYNNFQITSAWLKNSPGYVFWLKKLKNDIKIALKPTGIKLKGNPIKIYYAVYICEQKMM